MKFEKHLTVSLGGYEGIKIGIINAPSYEDCDRCLIEELKRLHIPISNKIKTAIQWNEQ